MVPKILKNRTDFGLLHFKESTPLSKQAPNKIRDMNRCARNNFVNNVMVGLGLFSDINDVGIDTYKATKNKTPEVRATPTSVLLMNS